MPFYVQYQKGFAGIPFAELPAEIRAQYEHAPTSAQTNQNARRVERIVSSTLVPALNVSIQIGDVVIEESSPTSKGPVTARHAKGPLTTRHEGVAVASGKQTVTSNLSFPLDVQVSGERAYPIFLRVDTCTEDSIGKRGWSRRSVAGFKNYGHGEINADSVRQSTTASVTAQGKIIAWRVVAGSSFDEKPLVDKQWLDPTVVGDIPHLQLHD